MRNLHCPFCGHWPINEKWIDEESNFLFGDFKCPQCLAKVTISSHDEGVPAMRLKSGLKDDEIRRG